MTPTLESLGIDKFDDEEGLMLVTALWIRFPQTALSLPSSSVLYTVCNPADWQSRS